MHNEFNLRTPIGIGQNTNQPANCGHVLYTTDVMDVIYQTYTTCNQIYYDMLWEFCDTSHTHDVSIMFYMSDWIDFLDGRSQSIVCLCSNWLVLVYRGKRFAPFNFRFRCQRVSLRIPMSQIYTSFNTTEYWANLLIRLCEAICKRCRPKITQVKQFRQSCLVVWPPFDCQTLLWYTYVYFTTIWK